MLQHSCCPQQQHVVLLYAAALLLLATTCQACTIFQFQNDGFASNALYLLRAIPIFYGQNGTLYLDNTDFPYACGEDGGFHDFFKDDEHLVPWSAAKQQAAGDGECARVSFGDVDKLIYNTSLPHFQLELLGVQRAWGYRKWVRDWLEANRIAPLQGLERPTVGFHIRGGDVFEVDNELGRASMEPADFIRAFRRRFPGVRGGTCIFSGDEREVLAEAAEAAAEALDCTPAYGAAFPLEEGFSREGFGQLDLDARCGAGLQLLGDMDVLARADYFVASYHSRWSRVVEALRYGLYHQDRATTVDASPDHADLFSRIHGLFEQPGSEGRQRSANVAGDAELEVTAMELEEAEARGEPMPKEASVAAVSDSEEAEPHAKGSWKIKEKKKKKGKKRMEDALK